MTEYSMEQHLSEIEELICCGHCKRPFNDTTHLPKDLACKHTFCLECIQTGLGKSAKGSTMRLGELYCELCWKLTELTEKGPQALETNSSRLGLVTLYLKLKGENSLTNGNSLDASASSHEATQHERCPAHGSPLGLWCVNCEKSLCIECQRSAHADIRLHQIWSLEQAKDQMKKEAFAELSFMTNMDENVRQLARRQRHFLIMIRDACNALMREVQSSLDGDWNVDPTADIREALSRIQLALCEAQNPKEVQEIFSLLLIKKQTLQAKCREMIIQCQLNDLIGHSEVVFNFDTLRQSVASILASESDIKPPSLNQPLHDPVLFLTNYCMSQLFSRLHQHQRASGEGALIHNMQRQLVMSPPNITLDPTPPAMPEPSPPLSLQDSPESFGEITDASAPQVEYPLHQPIISVPLEIQTDTEISRPPTPVDVFTLATSSHTTSNDFTPPTHAAQVTQVQSPPIEDGELETSAPIIHPPARPVPIRSPANVCPRYYFNININGAAKGQIIIETRPDVAPKMCRNFDRLTTADRRASYKGCSFFQCWKNESVITGDYEFNTGRGGKSIYEDGYFQPDETRLPGLRGAVGMRRQQKKHDYFGAVGSQFRIILQDTQAFTGIFGQVVSGIEIVDLIASHGDQTGKPVKPIMITRCGKL
ncbi:hypothetical protein ONE63_008396 [Megalurothrips usitatus]|uniref:Uncharacterized protein n=1 Tax=Megalurothrips usitatus TaxID=439358 RepID=A0AAV7XL01_9NEOP|nr:hypothetical protein ONE63_008396 [Megalurothrips usitatus]